jgi:sensor histidine kinase regulating citrate/malate metabolism
LQNAKDALNEGNHFGVKNILISINKTSNDFIQIQVKDNGIGIDACNLIKIFSFGYTTKKTGHGFGLHSSALTAKELGGTLEALSDGLGQGAVFLLTLPLNFFERKKSHEHYTELASYRD